MNLEFIYRNDRTKESEDDNKVCKVCDRKLNYLENCIGNEKVTICYNCVHDIKKATPDITEER